MTELTRFTIPIPPVTKKNHQQIVTYKKTLPSGKIVSIPRIIPSKQYIEYEKNAKEYMPSVSTIYVCCNIKCLFYMPTRRRCDLTNLLEAIDDILVKYRIIEDDNYRIVESHDGSRVLYDKENPRTEVTITKAYEEERE